MERLALFGIIVACIPSRPNQGTQNMSCTNDTPHCDDSLPFGRELLKNVDVQLSAGIPVDVPLLVTLRCSHCRGGKRQILTQGMPHELVCEHCGRTLNFELQS
jgi:hypothetical protein